MTYNPQLGRGKPYSDKRETRKQHGFAMHAWPSQRTVVKDKTDRFPQSVLPKFPQDQGCHGTQKPVALFEYLIRTYSNPGDLVLDNAMGSGTTLIACLNTGRRGIGIEKDAGIFATARTRVTARQNELSEMLIPA